MIATMMCCGTARKSQPQHRSPAQHRSRGPPASLRPYRDHLRAPELTYVAVLHAWQGMDHAVAMLVQHVDQDGAYAMFNQQRL
jgi:hypothetical protein